MNPTLPITLALLAAGCTTPEPAPTTPEPTAAELQAPEEVRALAADPPPESDLPPTKEGTWSLACGAALELEPAGALQILERDGLRPLGGQAVGTPAISADRRRIVWAHAPVARPETVLSVLACDETRWSEPRTLIEGPGAADRVAISPDGAWVFWFSGASGLPSLWASPFEHGAPKQMTNADLAHEPGSGAPPEGFVPPPHRGPPVVETIADGGYRITWQAPDGLHSVELPR